MKNILVYPAVFTYDDDGVSIAFPDFKGCVSGAKNPDDAMYMARDALSLRLWSDECDGITFPEPSDIFTIEHESNQAVILVDVDMREVRANNDKKTVNVMVTLPQWLVFKSRKINVNFSQTLQDTLTRKFGKKLFQ